MAAPPMSLKDSILSSFAEAEKAAGSVPAGTVPVTDDKTVEVEVEDDKAEEKEVKKEEKKEEKEEDEFIEIDASPEEIRNALNIVRALSNKDTAAATMEDLAKITGYKLETKTEVKKFERDVKSVLKEKLGDAYDLLSGDKLAEAFDALLEERVGAITKPVLDRIESSERAAHEQKANAAMDALWSRNNVTDKGQREKLSGKMVEKMKALPAGPGTDVNAYLDDIYALVTRDTEAARTVKKTVTKIKQNAQDVSRTSGDGSGDNQETRVKMGSKLPSIRESVEAAFRGQRLEE
jgi:hypothetical protein